MLNSRDFRVLFVIRAVEHFLYFRSIVEALSRRNHKVVVLFDKVWSQKGLNDDSLIRLKGVTYAWAKRDKTAKWRRVVFYVLDILSLRRYFKIPGTSSFYRGRWESMMPSPVRLLFKISPTRGFFMSDVFHPVLKFIADFAPVEEMVKGEIGKFDPDVVIASPVNLPSSSADLEYLRVAKKLAVPTVLPVFSWDNLTTKGVVHVKPDLLLVWNDMQAREAVRYHGIDKKTIRICGSPFFDPWFSYNPMSLNIDKFSGRMGLSASDPIILYLGSSVDTAGDETWIVTEIRKALDRDTGLSKIQIIVRPHPHNAKIFGKFKLPKVIVIPKDGSYPDTEAARKLYFECLYFSKLVVGVNTSGMIDAIIQKKPVVSFFDKEHTGTQTEAEHWGYLVKSEAISVAGSMESFLSLIKLIIRGGDKKASNRSNFVRRFIRPKGLAVSAGETAVIAVEQLVGSR